ncbi:MAG: tetratricopeptide repeat protein [Bacteroidales bacterium]|nr:tetratricopeptide repeat protein [Bacteroidales bacterium]MCF8387256.1 tetratricopeptide repeat protein [Bacteroidales bacterium]MCF8399547.1 tetratricopeptide repeat protein [Bacteroidales bacterium]
MSKQETEIWIEKYLAGDLNEREKAEFEKKLDENPEFKKFFDHYKNIKKTIDYKDRVEFLSKLEEVESKYFKKRSDKKNKPGNKGLFFSLAAVTLLLISTGLYLVFKEGQKSGQELFNQYFSPLDQFIEFRSKSESESAMIAGIAAYQQGKLDKAIVEFKKAGKNSQQQNLANLYLGITYLGKDKLDKAIPLFERLTKSQTDLRQSAEWYLGLAYLKMGKLNTCQQILEKIKTEEGHYYQAKARKLVNDLMK